MITKKQRGRLNECLADPACKVTFWCSDQWGRPANHICNDFGKDWQAHPGRVDVIEASDPVACSDKALHGTDEPHMWSGCRVWIVALWDFVRSDNKLWDFARSNNKYVALKREIICEIMPEEVIAPTVAARYSMKDLQGADLRDANFWNANLEVTNLQNANLVDANLVGACLRCANFLGADLRNANFRNANLNYANLVDANLVGAYLRYANFLGADLWNANFQGANFTGTIMPDGNLFDEESNNPSKYGARH